jgi:hypothetical protein
MTKKAIKIPTLSSAYTSRILAKCACVHSVDAAPVDERTHIRMRQATMSTLGRQDGPIVLHRRAQGSAEKQGNKAQSHHTDAAEQVDDAAVTLHGVRFRLVDQSSFRARLSSSSPSLVLSANPDPRPVKPSKHGLEAVTSELVWGTNYEHQKTLRGTICISTISPALQSPLQQYFSRSQDLSWLCLDAPLACGSYAYPRINTTRWIKLPHNGPCFLLS